MSFENFVLCKRKLENFYLNRKTFQVNFKVDFELKERFRVGVQLTRSIADIFEECFVQNSILDYNTEAMIRKIEIEREGVTSNKFIFCDRLGRWNEVSFGNIHYRKFIT